MNLESIRKRITDGFNQAKAERRGRMDELLRKGRGVSPDEAEALGRLCFLNDISIDQAIDELTREPTREARTLRCQTGIDQPLTGERALFLSTLVTGPSQGQSLDFDPSQYRYVRASDQSETEFSELLEIVQSMPGSYSRSSVSSAAAVKALVDAGVPDKWAHQAASVRTRAAVMVAIAAARLRVRLGMSKDFKKALLSLLDIPADAVEPDAPVVDQFGRTSAVRSTGGSASVTRGDSRESIGSRSEARAG